MPRRRPKVRLFDPRVRSPPRPRRAIESASRARRHARTDRARPRTRPPESSIWLETASGSSRSSIFAPKIVARARSRGAAAAPDDAPPESAAPAAEELPRARAGRAPNLPQRKPREGKEKTPAAAPAPDPAAGTRAPQSAAEAASGASRLRGVPAAALDARTKAARDKEARHLEARAAMPPPPSVPARAAAAAAAAPPRPPRPRDRARTRAP